MMWYRAGADLVVVVHLLFIGFILGGVFLAWRWPWIIWAHIPAVVYGALVEFAGFTCPLTLLENHLRHHAGQAGYRGGFIAHYLVKLIYPPGLTRGMQIGLGLLVLLVAVIGYRGFLRRHPLGPVQPGRWPVNTRQEHQPTMGTGGRRDPNGQDDLSRRLLAASSAGPGTRPPRFSPRTAHDRDHNPGRHACRKGQRHRLNRQQPERKAA